jgi:hypothetical protein
VAQIDAPQLNFLHIEYLDQDIGTDYQIPQLCKFIDRSDIPCFRRADLLIEAYTVIVELYRGRSSFRLVIQEDAVGQVVNQLSALLFDVDRLFITSVMGEEEDLGDRIPWLELLRPFTAVKALSVVDELTDHISLALNSVTGERATEVLPALELLFFENQKVASIKKFVAARQNVGCPVAFIDDKSEFQERLSSLAQ